MSQLHHLRSTKGRNDTTKDILPGALVGYGINPNEWREYALFVSFDGPANKPQEMCFGLNDHPLGRFRKMKEEMRNPVFILRHLREVPSPVVRARTKGSSGRPISGSTAKSFEKPLPPRPEEATSFGIAIFPYAAVQDDELDVDLDDTVLVISKPEPGWWLVQHTTPSGPTNRGLVPTGCFLETAVPPLRSKSTPSTRSLTIPFSDVRSRCRQVVVLADYTAHEEGELTVLKEELVNEYKRYYYWSYVIKVENGERGWVPGWLVAPKS